MLAQRTAQWTKKWKIFHYSLFFKKTDQVSYFYKWNFRLSSVLLVKICSVKLFVRKSILIFIDLPSASSSDDSTCIIITNLVMEIKMCHLLSFWILFPVKIVQKHVCTSCMHFELLIEQVSVLIQSPACMHHFMPAAGTLFMHAWKCMQKC